MVQSDVFTHCRNCSARLDDYMIAPSIVGSVSGIGSPEVRLKYTLAACDRWVDRLNKFEVEEKRHSTKKSSM
ncbi:hypothetical protein HYALB_00013487 [Hymenoscyphus albidus]|uniref:Uncharacterized protein n=1 Tax=Hymenoscyphus albidus TaxID=595503 RepID=A0A9N9LTT2_9HELO|nr:hypothetical protein HYALB_00013487 [Hymenoscyphus albidus]